MANEVDYNPCQYKGNGATRDFPFDWKVLKADEIIVSLELVSTGNITILRRGSDYTVQLEQVGGNIKLTTAPSEDYFINISRDTSDYQGKRYSTSVGFDGKEIEKSFDQVSCNLQEMQYGINKFEGDITKDVDEKIQANTDLINRNKIDTDRQIADNKKDTDKQIATNKQDTDKQILDNNDAINARQDAFEEKVNTDLAAVEAAAEKVEGVITNCITSMPNNAISHSGNTITLKQGIQLAVADGLTPDNKLNSIAYTLNNDKTATFNSYPDGKYVGGYSIVLDTIAILFEKDFYMRRYAPKGKVGVDQLWFNLNENRYYWSNKSTGTWNKEPSQISSILFRLTIKDGNVVDFTSANPIKVTKMTDLEYAFKEADEKYVQSVNGAMPDENGNVDIGDTTSYVKTDGSSVMTGALKFEDSGYIERNNSPSTKGLALFGDKDGYGTGASIALRSNTASGSQAGAFKLETGNNVTGHTHTLQGNPDGTIQWDGKELANQEFITSKISNCITEIPQDIKLELKNGVLILKAGSKIYIPNGANNFEVKTIDKDISYSNKWGSATNQYVLIYNKDTNNMNTRGVFEGTSGVDFSAISTQYGVRYNLKDNKIKLTSDSGKTWTGTLGFPLCIISGNNTGIVSIDKVFNGFGYIGSTVFALPGVKGLIPDGRNEDDSLKNINFELNNVLIQSNSAVFNNFVLRLSGDRLSISNSENFKYDYQLNYVLDNNLGLPASCALIGYVNGNNGITSLITKQPFHALDYNDKSTISSWSMPSDKYIELTLGASGTKYIAPANGWYLCSLRQSVTGDLTISNGKLRLNSRTTGANQYNSVYIPALKQDSITIEYQGTAKDSRVRFYYAQGEI